MSEQLIVPLENRVRELQAALDAANAEIERQRQAMNIAAEREDAANADAEALAEYARWMAGKNTSSNSAWDSMAVRMDMVQRARDVVAAHEGRVREGRRYSLIVLMKKHQLAQEEIIQRQRALLEELRAEPTLGDYADRVAECDELRARLSAAERQIDRLYKVIDEKVEAIGDLVVIEQRDAAEIARLREALAFYANPETYFAISFAFDPPCGEFRDDFEELTGRWGHPDGGPWTKPGKRAREALNDFLLDEIRLRELLALTFKPEGVDAWIEAADEEGWSMEEKLDRAQGLADGNMT